MKILIVQDHLRSGGTERQSILLANAFSAAGNSTGLLTFRPGGALDSTVSSSVKRWSLQKSDRGLDWFAPGLAAAVRQFGPDIILCMGRMANCRTASLKNAYAGATVIATMRTGKSLPWLFRHGLRVAQHVVANSHQAQSLLVSRYRIPATKISVIYNSLIFGARPAEDARRVLRTRYGAGSNTCVLLNVAMFRPEKNQRELIEIAATFPHEFDWQLWLAGEGPARAHCERLVAEKQLIDRVKFTGFAANPADLYASADIAVHASSSESLSNFLIEAQSHGLPAVAYSAQGIRETFVPDRTGWEISRGDRTAFRDRVQALSRHPQSVRTDRAAQAQRFALETFDAANQVTRYLELFAQLLSAAGRAS